MRVFSGGGGAAQGNSFVDRGDPAAADYAVGDLTKGAWTDLDLSSIVPAGAKCVVLTVKLLDDALSGQVISFRENGNSNTANIAQCYYLVANANHSYTIEVALDSNRVIEYNLTNTTWSTVNIYVRGWYV